MAHLDIIVTHRDEPWNVGKAFFDMIQYQRCVSSDTFTVTLVQDPAGTFLPWEILFEEYSYDVNVITADAEGTANARNAGMKATKSQWIMFCDFDDMFNDLCALKMIVDNFPVDDYNMIWGKYITEEKWNGGSVYINKIETPSIHTTDCKFYRRAFLEENNIQFNPNVQYHYEYMFNSLVLNYTPEFMIVTFDVPTFFYCKTFNDNGFSHSLNGLLNTISTRFDRHVELAKIFQRRGDDNAYRRQIALAVCNEYFRVYDPDREEPTPSSPEFLSFYRKNRKYLDTFSKTELEIIKDEAEHEIMNSIQTIYNNFLREYYIVNDAISFDDWLRSLDTNAPIPVNNVTPRSEKPSKFVEMNKPTILRAEDYSATPAMELTTDTQEPELSTGREPRVVVYCGTFNTYADMLTSAKSVLSNTLVDKIYFLIEDDTFPYELPDIIECINVKDQTFFPESGPNYQNPWSYMCMMRAAFSKLIPYDKILSFDIDIIVQEDISNLWDIDLSDYYLAGVSEPQRQKSSKDPLYINFGVVMMNLKAIREDGIDDAVINALNSTRFGCPEQDAFNKFCAGHIFQLSNDYNATVHSHITGEAERERIIHFAGLKFWRHYGSVKEYHLQDWNYIMNQQKRLAQKEQSAKEGTDT